MAGPLGQERPQRGQLAGLVDVDPQEPCRGDRVLVAALRARAAATPTNASSRAAFAGAPVRVGAVADLLGVREQGGEPARVSGRAAGQEVLGPGAPVEPQLAVRAPGARA